jgi:4'-phosphopantetheinyl transferase
MELPPASFWPDLIRLPDTGPRDGEVWVWSFPTTGGPFLPRLETLLNDQEAQRANRLRSNRAQAEFVSGRGLLRLVLGRLLNCPPQAVRLSTTGNGKPVLAPDQSKAPLHFNIAHSHGMGLLALAGHAELGVDIEKVRPVGDQDSLARRYFHPNEVQHLEGLSVEAERRLAFFHGWTRKEAFLKATATGIGFGLDRVEVTLGAEVPARLVCIDNSEENARGWTLKHLEPSNGWMAALALKAPCSRLVTGHARLDQLTG